MRLAVIALVVACGGKTVATLPAPVVSPKPAPTPAPVVESIWPVPMRVMTWTPDGVVEIGVLPDKAPAQWPSTPWYVEPTKPIDRPAFDRIVKAVRTEHVQGLSLRGQPVAPWLGELRDLPELTSLILDDTDTETLAFDLPLRRLYLARTFVGDAAIATLKTPELAVLDLEDCPITDRGVATITKLSQIHALNLAGTRITDAGGGTLGALGKLQILDLGGTTVGAKTIAAIRPLAIRELFLEHTRVGKELATLAGFAPGITRFEISALQAYKPTDADLAWLAKAPLLVEVGLSGAKVHDPLVLAIAVAVAPNLREIRLAGTLITIAVIRALAKLDKLEEVDLAETPVDDPSAAALLAMPHMRALRLDRTAVTDAALRNPSPVLVELYLSGTKVGDGGLALLDATPKLEGLGLADTQLGDGTIARIAKLSELRTLVLSKARTGRQIIGELGKLHELERLYLDETRIGDEQLATFTKLRELRVLHLAGTDVSSESLTTLRTFTQLDELTLGDTRMKTGVANLDAWPRLRTLSLFGLDLTDDELSILARRRSLVTLDLSATEIRDPSPLAALPNLRTLGLANTKLTAPGEQAVKTLAARGVDVIR